MTMQDILIELSDYDVSCQIKNGFFMIGVSFNKDWQILEPVNPQIEFVSQNGMWYYAASLKEVTVDEVFQCIKETIEHNKDLERRLLLFQEKIGELEHLFKDEDYDKLKTLEFTFRVKEDSNKNDKKTSRRKKVKGKNTKEAKTQIEKENTEPIATATEEFKQQENTTKAYTSEPISVDNGVVFVDTIAEISGNKTNQNNYLRDTD